MTTSIKALFAAASIAALGYLAATPAASPGQVNRCPGGSLNVVRHQPHLAAYGFECKFYLQEFTVHGSRPIRSRAISENLTCQSRSTTAFHCDAVDDHGNPTSLPFKQRVDGLLRSKRRVCAERPLRLRIDAVGADSPLPTGVRIEETILLKAGC